MRIPSLALISVIFGTALTLLLPRWQECLVAAGDSRHIVRRDPPITVTLEARERSNYYYTFEADEVESIAQESSFQAEEGLRLNDQRATITPAKVTWTTGSSRNQTRHTAPGLEVRLEATAIAQPEQKDAWYDVTWVCPAINNTLGKARVEVHNGRAKWQEGHFLVQRLRVLPSATARQIAIFLMSLWMGLPFTLALLMTLIAVVVLRNVPRSPADDDPAGGRLLFPRSNKGARLYFSLWGGILYFVAVVAAGVCYTSDANLLNLPVAIAFTTFLALLPVPILAFTVWLMRRRQLEVETTSSGVAVRRGSALLPVFEAPWEEIASAEPGVRYYRGNIADEWVDLKSRDGRSVRVARNHVQEFPRLREFLVRRVSVPA